MKPTFNLLQRSSYDLSREILWNEHRQRGYIIRDPANSDELLYLTNSDYMKLVRIMLSNEVLIEVIATPRDTPESIARKFPESPNKTPKRAVLKEFLFNSNPLWRISDSMIDIRKNTGGFLPTYFKHIISWLNLKPARAIKRSIYGFGRYTEHIAKANGLSTLVLRLKISTIVVLKYLGGEKVTSTQSLGMRIRLRNGLPASLPLPLRSLIRGRNTPYIRVILSLLYSYKGLAATYKAPSLGTIVAPKFKTLLEQDAKGYFAYSRGAPLPPELLKFMGDKFLGTIPSMELYHSTIDFYNAIGKGTIIDIIPDLDTPPLIGTAGPNSPISLIGAGLDALAHFNLGRKSPIIRYLQDAPGILKQNFGASNMEVHPFRRMLDHMEVCSKCILDPAFLSQYDYSIPLSTPKAFTKRLNDVMHFEPSLENVQALRLGKLSLKYEAAGKVRVFAIVDYFTQWVLAPIHKGLFDILRRLPTDATFDQLGKVSDFSKKGYTYIASFDLKAATDLIPRRLYKEVLKHFFGEHSHNHPITDMWLEILVDRVYEIVLPYKPKFSVSEETALVPYVKREIPNAVRFFVRYGRGQPMGALSSWASLALVHHFLVFVAATRARVDRFRDYLVLGDDIVIANRDVALAYQEVCQTYGITIGLPKSFVSEIGLFQFASQDVIGSTNVSPISLKEVLAIDSKDHLFFRAKGIVSLSARVEFVNRLVWKGFIVANNPLSLVRAMFAPQDWKAISRSLSRGLIPPNLGPALLLLLTAPQGVDNNNINLSQVMALLRGDLHGLVNGREFGLLDRIKFLVDLYHSFDKEFTRIFLRVENVLAKEQYSYLGTMPIAQIYLRAAQSRQSQDLQILEDIRYEWEELYSNTLRVLQLAQLESLWYELVTLPPETNLEAFHKFGRLVTRLTSLGNGTMLNQALVSPVSIQRLRKVRSFVSSNPYWIEGRTMSSRGTL